MKLWQKIFVSTLALMVLSASVVSILLLKNGSDALWDREESRAVAQHQYLAGMLRTGVISSRLQMGTVQLGDEETKQSAEKVLQQQALDRYLSGIVLLTDAGEKIYEDMPEGMETLPDPPAEDPEAAVYELRSGAEENAWYLVVAMPVRLEGLSCRLGAAYYVGDLQMQLNRQAVTTVTLCLLSSLAGAGLLLILVLVLLRPLARLDRNAKRIAEGQYDQRIQVRGNDELAGLARDMNLMADAVEERVTQLEQVAEDRRVFIGNLAHEMKTPLTSILGFADLLYLPKDVPDDRRVEYAQIISEEAKRLRSLSGKLLELTTLGSSRIQMSPASLSATVEEVETSMKPLMDQSGLRLVTDCPDVQIDMDQELFKSLLYNLLDNARKAGSSSGTVVLAARTEGDRVRILVRDYGTGIPREELDKITQPFYMVDKSRARKAGGAGLGLSLCQEIVKVHGGSMDIDSVKGEGTLVTLEFPLSDPEGRRSE